MTIPKEELAKHEKIVVEYGSAFGYGSETVELTEIRDITENISGNPLEITGLDENGEKYRIYLDKNKVELVQDENNEFVGCIGTVMDIFEPLEE